MVTRIEDRTLYYGFVDIVKKLYEAKKPSSKQLKYLFEYLFVVSSKDPLDWNGSGCGLNNPIVLTNSIGLAENERLKKAESNEIRTSELLLCKVYMAEINEHNSENRYSTCINNWF